MKTDTPSELPTHLLGNPDQYISRVGRILRKTSVDELPQLVNILRGDMSIIGPRPALWNQVDLIDERDQYRANDVRPGLTGWAQINGRDKLDIPKKARFDGEYAEKLLAGKGRGFAMDVRCFVRTIIYIFKSDDVIEGHAREAKEKNADRESADK